VLVGLFTRKLAASFFFLGFRPSQISKAFSWLPHGFILFSALCTASLLLKWRSVLPQNILGLLDIIQAYVSVLEKV